MSLDDCAELTLDDDNTKTLIGFHYNGHDVPRPTENGEIWVFSERMDQVR